VFRTPTPADDAAPDADGSPAVRQAAAAD
jgi:hypothetical protein